MPDDDGTGLRSARPEKSSLTSWPIYAVTASTLILSQLWTGIKLKPGFRPLRLKREWPVLSCFHVVDAGTDKFTLRILGEIQRQLITHAWAVYLSISHLQPPWLFLILNSGARTSRTVQFSVALRKTGNGASVLTSPVPPGARRFGDLSAVWPVPPFEATHHAPRRLASGRTAPQQHESARSYPILQVRQQSARP